MRRLRSGFICVALLAAGPGLAQSPEPGKPLSAERQLEIKTSIARQSRGLKPGQELPKSAETFVVGATVPASTALVTLPQEAFSAVPEVTSYSFVLMEKGIAVVDPATRKVIQVIE